MGSPRHSPCLGYLSATLFILSISLQCVNSLNGVFNVQTKYVKKPIHTLRPHHLHNHDRMLLGSASIDIQVRGGNATVPLYIMEVGIGTPPQIHRVLLDTGSSEIWVNCASCENCITDLNGVHIPSYDPSLSSTSRIYKFGEDHCRENINGRCRFITGYAQGRGMDGFVLEDKFLIGNPLIGQAISANLRFGCVTKQNYTVTSDGTDFFNWGIDGIIGFGNFGHSIVRQFNHTGIPSQELAHCLDNIKGGGVFAFGHVIEPQVPMADRFDNDYDMLLLGMDFGGANVTLNGSSLAIFDCGSDKLFAPDLTFQDINRKFEALLAQKNAVVKQRANASSCFQLPGRTLTHELVDQEFPNITLHFPGSMLFTVKPHNYIRPEIGAGDELEDFWCLFVTPMSRIYLGDNDIFFVGSSFMSEKLMVYDNVNSKIGFVDHDCSVPIQVEGDDGKPISLGPIVGDDISGKMF